MRVVKKQRSVARIIMSLIFSILVISWAVVYFYDFQRFSNDQKPLIVIREVVHEFDDGVVIEHISLGYKFIEYRRASMPGREFVPIWIGIRTLPVEQ